MSRQSVLHPSCWGCTRNDGVARFYPWEERKEAHGYIKRSDVRVCWTSSCSRRRYQRRTMPLMVESWHDYCQRDFAGDILKYPFGRYGSVKLMDHFVGKPSSGWIDWVDSFFIWNEASQVQLEHVCGYLLMRPVLDQVPKCSWSWSCRWKRHFESSMLWLSIMSLDEDIQL